MATPGFTPVEDDEKATAGFTPTPTTPKAANPNKVPAGAPRADVYTPSSIARGAALGAFEGLGVSPSTSGSEVITGSLQRFGEGMVNLIKGSWEQEKQALPQWSPVGRTALMAFNVPANFFEQTATGIEQGFGDTYKAMRAGDYESAAQHLTSTVTTLAMLRSARGAVEANDPGSLRQIIKDRVGPENVRIANEDVPVLKGEAHPERLGGRIQREMKRSGAGEQKFRDFAVQQQEAVKRVIRKVGQQSSGLIGPMADEPAEAMHDAADATFAKARPMYQEMDRSLVTIPDSMGTVSKVVEQAIARAEKLGAKISRGEPEEVWVSGQRYTPQNNPRAWELLKRQGMIPAQAGQSLESYMKVRSELLKMKRAATDASQRYAIDNELHSMNANMETALRGTPLHDNWIQAERLWSKGYAIRDVADALKKSTKGTPTSVQAGGLGKVPTRITGRTLVARLNDLQSEGILEKAFSRQEAVNLRQAADILDRASGAPGREFGFGYGIKSTFWRNLVKLPFSPLVKAMTSTEGLEALREFDKASTAAKMGAAANKFARIAGVTTPIVSTNQMRESESEQQKQMREDEQKRRKEQRKPGQQIRDLRAIQEKHSDNPNMPIGPGQ